MSTVETDLGPSLWSTDDPPKDGEDYETCVVYPFMIVYAYGKRDLYNYGLIYRRKIRRMIKGHRWHCLMVFELSNFVGFK